MKEEMSDYPLPEYKEVRLMRSKLISNLQLLDDDDLGKIKERFNTLALDFFEWEIPKRYSDKVATTLDEAKLFIDDMTDEDFVLIVEGSLERKNEILAMLSRTSKLLNQVLTEIGKELGYQ